MAPRMVALMPEWEELLKIGAALASGGLLTALLARRTGRETNRVTQETAALREMTARLMGDLDTMKAALSVYQAIGDERAKLVDAVRSDLAAAQVREAAAHLREVDCQQRLTRTEARLNALFGGRPDSYD